MCKSMFFDAYYVGNILYFIGALAFTVPLLIFEQMQPRYRMTRTDSIGVAVNALFWALALTAYAGFDRVLVGLVFVAIMLIIAVFLFVRSRQHYRMLPYTFYTLLAYGLAVAASVIVRLR